MTTHTRLRLGAVALVLLVVALLSGAHLCGMAQEAGSRPLSTGALACTEFWLNRYQTLLGALVAVGAAVLTWEGLKKQIAVGSDQLKIGQQQFAVVALEYYIKRVTILKNILGYHSQIIMRTKSIAEICSKNFTNINLIMVPGEDGMVLLEEQQVEMLKETISIFDRQYEINIDNITSLNNALVREDIEAVIRAEIDEKLSFVEDFNGEFYESIDFCRDVVKSFQDGPNTRFEWPEDSAEIENSLKSIAQDKTRLSFDLPQTKLSIINLEATIQNTLMLIEGRINAD